jgi:hypothetical protein
MLIIDHLPMGLFTRRSPPSTAMRRCSPCFLIAGYRTVLVAPARRLVGGAPPDAVVADYRVGLERLFEPLRSGAGVRAWRSAHSPCAILAVRPGWCDAGGSRCGSARSRLPMGAFSSGGAWPTWVGAGWRVDG